MHTVSVSLLSSIFYPASRKGVDKQTLLRIIDFDESFLEDPENRVPCGLIGEVMALVSEISGDPNFALFYGEHFQPANLNVVGYILANSPNVGAAYRHSLKYSPIIGNGLEMTLTEDDKYARVETELISPELIRYKRYIVEKNFSMQITAVRQLTGKKIFPEAVYFSFPAPADISEHQRIFGCDLIFNAAKDEIVFKKSLMDEPIGQANPKLHEMLTSYAEEIMERVSEKDSLSRQVSKLLLNLIPINQANLETVAEKLAIGVRTLQRELKREGVTFNELLGNVRKEVAIRHLAANEHSIAEISYMLGFSEPSVFHRSFKRWTGKTPRDYRMGALEKAS